MSKEPEGPVTVTPVSEEFAKAMVLTAIIRQSEKLTIEQMGEVLRKIQSIQTDALWKDSWEYKFRQMSTEDATTAVKASIVAARAAFDKPAGNANGS
jgi:hypothetical protein